jgi:predicted AAA+ superfamily ATPase
MGLAKYSGARVRQRASSPKLLVLNTALMTTQSGLSLEETRKNRELWGRLVKPAVGAHLANATRGTAIKLYYWLDRNREVDFVLERGEKLVAIEVKSGRERVNLPGTLEFSRIYPRSKKLLVGSGGIPIERFFRAPVGSWVE